MGSPSICCAVQPEYLRWWRVDVLLQVSDEKRDWDTVLGTLRELTLGEVGQSLVSGCVWNLQPNHRAR